jgi:hypothetical protein
LSLNGSDAGSITVALSKLSFAGGAACAAAGRNANNPRARTATATAPRESRNARRPFDGDSSIFILLVLDPLTGTLLAQPDRLSSFGSERLDGDQVGAQLGHELLEAEP